MSKSGKRIALLTVLTAVFWMINGAVSLAATAIDRNEEIQNVMGDLSALKTAAQMYYSDNGNDPTVPPLSSLLLYFEDGSLPSNASSLYAIKGSRGVWYVGYRDRGLNSVTRRELEENASSLGLLGDDLRSPWRRGSAYLWSSAMTVGLGAAPVGGTIIQERDSGLDSAFKGALILAGAAAFLHIIRDDRDHRDYYYYPQHPWRWRSSLIYRPSHRDRFYRRFSRPAPRPRPRFSRPAPVFRRPRPEDHFRRPPIRPGRRPEQLRREPRRRPTQFRREPERRPAQLRREPEPGRRRPPAQRPPRPQRPYQRNRQPRDRDRQLPLRRR